MSSILKALEKVEESQAAKRSGGPSGLVKSKQRRPAWVLPAGVLGGAAIATLITYAAMGGFSNGHQKPAEQNVAVLSVRPAAVAVTAPVTVKAAASPATSTPSAAEKSALSAPAASAGPAKGVPTTAATKVAAAPPKKTHAGNAAAQNKKVAAAKTKKVTTAQAKKAAAVAAKKVAAANAKIATTASAKKGVAAVPSRTAQVIPPPPVVRPAAARPAPVPAAPLQAAPVKQVAKTVAPPPVPLEKKSEVRVTGIAWQNDSESSAAIVNGRMVQHGATVDGYKVERIFEDKVRFSGKNGTVEVPLGGGQ